MPSERAASSNEFLVHYSPECVEKLFDNSKLFLVWAPTSEQKRLKRSHFVVLTATGSRSEGLQRFIKQFRNRYSANFAFWVFPELRSIKLPHSDGTLAHRGGA